MLNGGRVLSMGRMKSSPADVTLLPQGTPVAVTFALGAPIIWGVLPEEVQHTDVSESITGTEGYGGEDPAFDRENPVTNRDPNTPGDMIPGDIVLRARDGAHLGALTGRVAMLSGSPLAEVQAIGAEDLVRIHAGELRTDTWMGFSEVVNEGGKTSFRWRGGSDQLSQTGVDEERFTLALDVGHAGDLLRFEITNRAGQALFRVHVDPRGRAEVFAAGGITGIGGDSPQAVHEALRHGSERQEITGGLRLQVGGDVDYSFARRWGAEVDGNLEFLAGGFVNLLGTDSASFQSGGEVLIRAARKARLRGDGTTLEPQLGVCLVDTARPDAIVLGTGATSHAVKYEELLTALTQLTNRVNELGRAMSTHVHSPAGSTAPLEVRYAVPVTPNWAAARATVVKIR